MVGVCGRGGGAAGVATGGLGMRLETEPPMAKKRATPRRPAPPEGPKKHILGIRGSEAFKDWLYRFAQTERSDMVDLVDDALAAYARARGFEPPPKR